MKFSPRSILLTALIGIALIGLALLILAPAPVLAAPPAPLAAASLSTPLRQSTEAPPAVGIIDVAFVLTCVAFFKTQFNLAKWAAVGLAAGVCVLVFVGPYIQAALTLPTGLIDGLVGLIRLFMYTAGGYDLFTDAGPKIFANMAAKSAK